MISKKNRDSFIDRHIGPRDTEIIEMLKETGVSSMNELIDETVPKEIRLKEELKLPEAISEFDYANKIKSIALKNKIYKSFQGQGYYPTFLPKAIQRNILENPGWYTQYTPYQAEISQGRLEALMNFQTMVIDLTGMQIANASLLDESTAAGEAMLMCKATSKNKTAKKFFIDENIFPQTIDVLITRAEPQNIEIVYGNAFEVKLDNTFFGAIVQYPGNDGSIINYNNFVANAHSVNVLAVAITDLLSLALIKTPGEIGFDVAVGSTQRFGVPMMFGGPHAAFFSTKEEFKRFLPGRIIGLSIDKHGNKAYRMALQTREQHIKREKATSNICTAQVLLAIMAGMYAIYHGEKGIQSIAERIHKMTVTLNNLIINAGFKQTNKKFFDTLKISVTENEKKNINEISDNKKINFRYFENAVGISLNEITSIEDVLEIANIFGELKNKKFEISNVCNLFDTTEINFEDLKRKTRYLTNEIFNKYHSETEFMRYLKSLENKDLSLTGSMIPLGSCTMKLNAASEMIPVSFPEFTEIHPFSPVNQTQGYKQLIDELGNYLCEITGFSGITFQPNSGAQGEYSGLMIIRKYQISQNQQQRNVVLIPCSAHGTNPASAVMAGMKVVVTACDLNGNIDIVDLKKKAEENKDVLSCLMVTYPSTHGVFEENIKEICNIIHTAGGQVYMDGANMNAQVGLTSPAEIGADCCHLNLHKTFASPHGGGGPGEGPVAVAKHLVSFLPHHIIDGNKKERLTAVSSAPYGSAGILAISYGYILMSGKSGLKKSTEMAILNANYVKEKLKNYFKTLYTGTKGRVAHELIFDFREFKHSGNIEVIDVAKRLMDYGFHAPTVSFPVGGTLMFEPTESEPKSELDRFISAMIQIRSEIDDIISGKADKTDNVIKNAPHTAFEIASDSWQHSYTRIQAAYPVKSLNTNKFWPSVGRINDAHGDRNLVCSCNPISDFIEK